MLFYRKKNQFQLNSEMICFAYLLDNKGHKVKDQTQVKIVTLLLTFSSFFLVQREYAICIRGVNSFLKLGDK